jgi:hypothetical protein
MRKYSNGPKLNGPPVMGQHFASFGWWHLFPCVAALTTPTAPQPANGDVGGSSIGGPDVLAREAAAAARAAPAVLEGPRRRYGEE